ncbi:MAG: chain length determinant protein EpsF [Vicinamibacterales bacterium]
MQLGLLFRILRARIGLILAILLITFASAAIGSFLMPRIYSPSTVVFVDVKSLDPVLGSAVLSPQSVRGVLATQREIIESERVVHAVIRQVGLDKRPDVLEAWQEETGGNGDILTWLTKGVLQALEVTPSTEGTTLTITYEGRNPQMATEIANAFAQQYLMATLSLRAEPAKQNASYFEKQAAEYRERVRAAQARMSEFQQKTGIVGTDERLDIENQRLQELSSQLVQIQALATEGRAKRTAISREGRESMPEVVQNPLIQTLKTELGRAEARLQEMSSRLGSNHPQLLSAQAEAASLRAKLNSEIGKVSGSIVAEASMNVQREGEIRAALEAQRQRVLRLKKDRDQLAVLETEVADAQKALDLVSQRLTQTNLESQAPQSNVSILSPAMVPPEPSRPKPVLNMVVGAFLGLILGVLAALSVESFKRPVRTADDLLQAIEIPVLAVLPPSHTRRAQRLIGSTGPSVSQPHLRLGN